jgi:hypothetical protein
MTTMAMRQSQRNSSNWFVKLLGLFFIAILVCVLYSVCEHALTKHKEAAIIVDQCLSNKGPHLGIWQRKSDGHFAFPCQLDNGKWGIKFDECTGDNCSAFIKDKFKKGWQLVKYLSNTGYEAFDDIAKAYVEKNPIPGELLNDW